MVEEATTHPCPIRERAPIDEVPVIVTNGSTTVSGPKVTPSSSVIVSGRISVAPAAIAAHVARRRSSLSTSASSVREFTPRTSEASSTGIATTPIPSATARPRTSVR